MSLTLDPLYPGDLAWVMSWIPDAQGNKVACGLVWIVQEFDDDLTDLPPEAPRYVWAAPLTEILGDGWHAWGGTKVRKPLGKLYLFHPYFLKKVVPEWAGGITDWGVPRYRPEDDDCA